MYCLRKNWSEDKEIKEYTIIVVIKWFSEEGEVIILSPSL